MQKLDLDLKNQTFILLFPYVWNPSKNIVMTFETFLMMSITTERYLATRNPLEYRVAEVKINENKIVFIKPRSHHSPRMSLTDSLTTLR